MVSHCELICLAMIIQGDVEHLFMCLLTTGTSSLEKYLFKFVKGVGFGWRRGSASSGSRGAGELA